MSSISKKITKLLQSEIDATVLFLAEKYGFDADEALTSLRSKETTSQPKAKKPPSAYILFCKAERPKVKSEHPDMPGPQILAELGRRWKSLDAEEKSKYTDEYKASMVDYQKV